MAAKTKEDELQREMAKIRRELDEGVEDFADNVRELADWHYYVRAHPWASMAVAAAIGFLAVPRRTQIITPDADTMLELAKRNKVVIKTNPKPEEPKGLGNTLFSLMSNMVLRSAVGFAGQQVGKWLQGTPPEQKTIEEAAPAGTVE